MRDVQECKVFFEVDTTKEKAQKIISRYADVAIDTFQPRREIGANVVTFAIVTLPVRAASRLVDDPNVKRVDIITTFKQANSKAEECQGGG